MKSELALAVVNSNLKPAHCSF